MAARTNLMTNPSFEVDLTGVTPDYGTSGAGSLTRPASGAFAGNSFARMTWTTGSSALSGGMVLATTSTVPAGSITASVMVRVNVAQRLRLSMGGSLNTPTGPAVDVPANTWTKLTFTASAVGGTGYSLVVLPNAGGYGRNWSIGNTLDVDAAILEVGAGGEFFDGSTTATGFRYVWDGAANASTSTETLPVDVRHTYTAAPGAVANPAVAVTDTPAPGDVLVLLVATGGVSASISAVTGCGATWSRVPSAISTNGVLDVWVGVGATASGTITTTGTAVARSLFVAMANGVTATAVGVTASGTGLQSSPAQTAGPGQIVFGMSYSTDAASTVTATTPSAGWSETDLMLAASAYSANVYRVPTASESHTFSVQRPSGTGYISQLVLGGTRTNLFTHPSAEGADVAWTTVLGTNSVARSSAMARTGSESYAMTTGANATQEFITPTGTAGFPVVAGDTYALSFYSRAATTLRTVTAKLAFYSAAGASLGVLAGGGTGNSTSAFTRHSAVVVAPATSAFAAVQIRVSSGPAGEVHYFDDFLLEDSVILGNYFSGASTQAGYTYAWTGTANASTSTEVTATSGSAPIASGFTGSGTLASSLARPARTISSALAGSGTLASKLGRKFSSALSSSGTLASDLTRPARAIASPLSGSGALSSALTRETRAISSDLSGTGSLSSSLTRPARTISSAFSGSGSLTSRLGTYMHADLSGSGTLSSAVTRPARTITSAFSASGSLSSALARVMTIASGFSGAGTLTSTLSVPTVLPPAPASPTQSGALGKLSSFTVSTSAVPLNPADGSGSTPSVSAVYTKGTDPEFAMGENNVLTNGAVGTYEGEVVRLNLPANSGNASISMNTPLTSLNTEMHLRPFIDPSPGRWTAARAIEYWSQQAGLFYDKVPGECIAYASGFGHTDSYGASTTARFYEKASGGSTGTEVINERSVKSFGADVTAVTALHETEDGAVTTSLPLGRKLVFSIGVGLAGSGRMSKAVWRFRDTAKKNHTVALYAESDGTITAKLAGNTIATASVPSGATYRLTLSLERLTSTTLSAKLTVHTDDLAGAGTMEHNGAPSTVTYSLPGVLKLWAIEHVSAGGSSSQMTRWGTYLTVTDSHPMELPAVQKVLAQTGKSFGFVSGFKDNVWKMLTEFCSIARLDVRFIDAAMHVAPRITELSHPGTWATFIVDSQRREKYKQVAVVNKQSKAVSTDDAVLWRADSVFQLNAREVYETTVQTPHSISNVVNPVPVPGILPFPYKKGGGQYVVTGADGYIISPQWWLDKGGKIEVSLTETEGEIAIKITAPGVDSVRAPYRISEGAADRPALYISGSGIINDPKEVHIATGAKNAREGFDNVFESPFIAGLMETYDTAMAMAMAYSSSVAEVSYELPNTFETPTGLGQYPAGALVTDNMRNYRILDAQQTASRVSGNAVPHTTIGAYVASYPPGATIADEKARHAGRTIRQFNIKPLKGNS